jgi:hypothetical protein
MTLIIGRVELGLTFDGNALSHGALSTVKFHNLSCAGY